MPHSFVEYWRLKAIISTIRFSQGRKSLQPEADESFTYKSRDEKRDIKVNVYRPRSVQSPSPVLLNWYGSAFVLPGFGSDDMFCRHIANRSAYTVLDAEYAIAPEYPFPAALEDAEDLISQVLQQPDKYDLNKVVLSGFSSGGNLALAAAANPEQSNRPRDAIRAVAVFYPPTNMTICPSDKRLPDGSPSPMPPFIGNAFSSAYIPSDVDPSNPRLTVLNAEASNFPLDVLIFTAEHDRLTLEAEELAAKLENLGKRVVSKRFQGVGHGWDKTTDEASNDAKERDVAYNMVVEFLVSLAD